MKRRSKTIGGLLSAVLFVGGCSTSSGTPDNSATNSTAAKPAGTNTVASVPAPGTAATPSAAPTTTEPSAAPSTATTSAAAAVPVSAASATSATAPIVTTAAVEAPSPEAIRKKAQIDWALRQEEIKNDPNGAWAVQAKASSAYNDAKPNAPYAASQATGAPNVERFGNNPMSWTSKTPDAGIEWLELQYSKPVHATAVRVRENYGAGAVMKVELFDEQGAPHTVWTGADSTKELDYLVVEFPKTAYKTARVKLTLATNVVGGANEIDAVQLVGTEQ